MSARQSEAEAFVHHGGMSTDAEVHDAMIELVGAGSMPRDDLLAAMQALDDSAGRTAERILRMDSAFADIDDVCYVPALVDGTSWTFDVDADDAAAGFVRMDPALSSLGWWLISSGAELVDDAGDPIGDVSTDGIWLDGRDTDVVIGPPRVARRRCRRSGHADRALRAIAGDTV